MQSRRRIFAFHQWTGFAVHWWTAVAEARKINEPNAGRRRRRGMKLVHSWSAKKSIDEARVQQ